MEVRAFFIHKEFEFLVMGKTQRSCFWKTHKLITREVRFNYPEKEFFYIAY